MKDRNRKRQKEYQPSDNRDTWKVRTGEGINGKGEEDENQYRKQNENEDENDEEEKDERTSTFRKQRHMEKGKI